MHAKGLFTMMDWYGNGMGAGSWVVMIAVMAVFWGVVIVAGVAIFRGSDRGGRRDQTQDRGAIAILDDRFARGEVDREEYEARKAVLRGRA